MSKRDIPKYPDSDETRKFYDDLTQGVQKRGIFGKDKRYNPNKILQDSSTKKYFTDIVKKYLDNKKRVLDFGCGPGSFLAAMAPYCGEIIGVDISKNFIASCQYTIESLKLNNASAVHIKPDELPFEDNYFDVLSMVDLIHHLEDINKSLREALRVIKAEGRIIIYEPNKLNPLIALLHLLDRNERGLLRVGSPKTYRKILSPYMQIQEISFNGIIIGPQSKLLRIIADILNYHLLKPFLGWLNPKILITGLKKVSSNVSSGSC